MSIHIIEYVYHPPGRECEIRGVWDGQWFTHPHDAKVKAAELQTTPHVEGWTPEYVAYGVTEIEDPSDLPTREIKGTINASILGTIRPADVLHNAHWFLDWAYANMDKEIHYDPLTRFVQTMGCEGKWGGCCAREFDMGTFIEELTRATGYKPKEPPVDPNEQYSTEQTISEVPLMVDGVRKLVKTVRSPLGPVQVVDGIYRTPIGPFNSYAEYLAEFRAGLARSHPKA